MASETKPVIYQPTAVDYSDYPARLETMTRGIAEVVRRHLDAKLAFISCINCNFFKEREGEICTAVAPFNARPPARVIAYGCSQHSSEIPF